MTGRAALRVVALVALCVSAGGAWLLAQPDAQAAARTRLLATAREAADLVRASDAPPRSPAEAGRMLLDVAGHLDALATALPQSPQLRDDLARAARVLRTLTAEATSAGVPPSGDDRRAAGVDTAGLLALIERSRAALEGEIALGLTFQGSYAQTRAAEPVRGGHAAAMGPTPAAPVAPADVPTSPVTFEPRPPLPTRTYAGGPSKDHILESAGNGIALIDYDGDGWLDVYLVTAAQLTASRQRVPQRNALYRNRGNWTFEDVSAAAGVDAAAWGTGVCAGDADGDGRVDLYVTNWGTNLLFRNRGDGTFDETAGARGVAGGGWSTGCAFFDADADGDLDLYVARYVRTSLDDLVSARRSLVWRNGPRIMVGPAGLPGESDLYFENLGGGRFREAAAAHGLDDAAGAYGFAVVTADLDADGDVDVFVANDSNPNFLFRNRGDGHFDSVGLLAGVAVNAEARAQAGMGADAGDVDGDGRLDLVLTAFAHDRNTLYRNLDGELFEDASVAFGLAVPTFERMGWGVALLDADLDGRLDLFVANGHIFADVGDYPALGESFAQPNQLLLNVGGGWRDVSATAGAGLRAAHVSRGLAVGDLDNDGDPDIVVANMDDTPTLLENRQQTGHHWLGLRLSSPFGNRLAIGARISVTAGDRTQLREIRSGGSYLSQHDLRAWVGLGDHAGPVAVEVRLPGGATFRWTDLSVDRLHDLVLTPERQVSPTGRRP